MKLGSETKCASALASVYVLNCSAHCLKDCPPLGAVPKWALGCFQPWKAGKALLQNPLQNSANTPLQNSCSNSNSSDFW